MSIVSIPRAVGALAASAALVALVAPGAGAAPKLTPLMVSTLSAPRPVAATDGRRHLAYELALANNNGEPVELRSLVVRSGGGRRLLALSGAGLAGVMGNFARQAATTLGATEGGYVWLDVALRRGARLPRTLVHRVTAVGHNPDGSTSTYTYDAARTSVRRQGAVELAPPLRGGLYMNFNGCCGVSAHRSALAALDGTGYISERFAVDLIQIDEHGVGGAGDLTQNRSFFTYGEPVLAVADARVVDTLDRVPENVPLVEPPSSSFNERTILGNHVTLALGHGRYATYMHLRPGSIGVHRGERVRRGQVLGRVGNTGQSGGPHLHFQVTDGRNPLASDGLPFVFRSFRLVGRVSNIDQFLTGQANADIHRDGRTGRMHGELPLQESVVKFAG